MKSRKSPVYPYVAEVESNVKRAVKETLGPRVIITGPNGSGKSAIVNTVELTLGEFISDIAGRARLSRGQDIIETAQDGADQLVASVRLSDNRSRKVSYVRKGTKVSTPDPEGDAIKARFITDEIENHLLGSPESARRYLLRAAAGTLVRADILRRLDESHHAAYIEAAAEVEKRLGSQLDEVTLLAEVRDHFGALAKQATLEADGAQATINSLSSNLPPLPTEAQMQAAEAAEAVALAALSAAPAPRVNAPTMDAVNALNDRLTAAFHALREVQFAWQTNEQEMTLLASAAPPAMDVDLDALDALIRVAVQHMESPTACGICGTPWHAAQQTHFSAVCGALAEAKQKTAAYEDWRNRAVAATEQADRVKAQLEQAQVAFRAAESAYVDAAARMQDTVDSGDRAQLEKTARDARDTVQRYRDTVSRWDTITAARRDVTQRRQAAQAAALLRDAVAEVIAGVVDAAISAFKLRVQDYLPPNDVFDIRLTDSVVRFGFVRNGHLHTGLSGAEWARLVVAMANALCEPPPGRQVDTTVVPIIVVRDKAWDAHTLRAAMVALADAPGQILLCHPTPPAGKLPKGWTHIVREGTPIQTPEEE